MTELSIVHVLRVRPPWRSAEHDLTECGLPSAGRETIGREEFVSRYRKLGRERTAMLTCMTCLNAFERYGRFRDVTLKWEDDPIGSLAREAEKVRFAGRNSEKRERLDSELRAIIHLIEEHRDEFEAILARMAWRAEREKEKAAKPKVLPTPTTPEGWV